MIFMVYYSLIKDFDIAVIRTSYPKKCLSPLKSRSIAVTCNFDHDSVDTTCWGI